MSFKPTSSGAFVRGVDASTGVLLQPRGSVPRASNFLLTKRGALTVCDGSQIVCAWNGVPTAGRGKAMCEFLFAPIGVSRYYLRVMKVLDQHLGKPQHQVAVDNGGPGSLNGAYRWTVTALDGAGGETDGNALGETGAVIAAGHDALITWNVVPNAAGGYNVYRTNIFGFALLIATVPQVPLGTTLVSFIDTGLPLGTQTPPATDNTQQTAMFIMSPSSGPVAYGPLSQVAIWPADLPNLDGGIQGGSGGHGGTGGGSVGTPGVTPSGVYPPGNVSFLPQIVQFVNVACIALGNSYPPQVYHDLLGTPDNPAVKVAVTAISVDSYGVVTVTTGAPHGLTAANVGACIILINGVPAPYNGCFQVITVPAPNQVTVRNLAAIGAGATSGGLMVVTTIPIFNTFTAQFDPWVAQTQYAVNSIAEPTVPNTFFYKVVSPQAGGQSGQSEPTWPLTIGGTVQDGTITWQNAGTTASAAPPPPGAAHISVYEGALWVYNTRSLNTTDGLDGPCVLRMSDVNQPNSWNPVNAAFLDKDDGFEGAGLQSFTITAQGIPPQGSLVATKLRALYQILGVFGSTNFTIQRISTDMGCLAPRTLQFVPGFGVGRLTHLGISIFDGVNDRLISPQVTPYLFPTNDPELTDITVADANWLPLAMGVMTANPAMYCVFIPIGNSNGALTRALCFDLVLKAWAIVDLPFPISATLQAQGLTSNPITLLGSFSDGTLQRWQAGDVQWATSSSGSSTPAPVAYMVRTPVVASKDPEQRIYVRRVIVIGQSGAAPVGRMTITARVNGVAQPAQTVALPATGRFAVQGAIGITSDLFDAIISGTGDITIDSFGWNIVPKPIGLLVGQCA